MWKYLATVVQVFRMTENNVQEIALHMGHELSVHRKFYHLQDDVIKLAKLSKLLLAVESGKAHPYKRMSLDDLDLNVSSKKQLALKDLIHCAVANEKQPRKTEVESARKVHAALKKYPLATIKTSDMGLSPTEDTITI